MPLFLHAAHEVRNAFDGLALVSWLAIGLGFGALALTWGRIFAWLRQPEVSAPRLRAWGQDDSGWYFEIDNAGEVEWSVETDDGTITRLTRSGEGDLFRPGASLAQPVALRSTAGTDLTL